jgi:CelD/BcsL family acetyltransferase involved in cellulose biosynthesis
MEKAGTCNLEIIRTADGYMAHEKDILEIAKNSWTEQVGDSLASRVNSSFFKDLSLAAAERRWLVVWLLSLDGKYVAFEYHLIYDQVLYGMRASFKDEYSHLSPGVYLDLSIVRSIFDNTLDVIGYDLGGNYDFYKKKWTDITRQNVSLRIFRKSLKLSMLCYLEYVMIPKVKRLKNSIVKSGKRE